ncbi:hypothetical protein Tco_0314889, partial [Tanacetum coccineum]
DHRSDIPEADMPSQNRLCLTATASRFIDTVDASIRASEGRVMTTIEEVNERAWSCIEDRIMALKASIRVLEAQVRTLQTQHDRMEWQRQ